MSKIVVDIGGTNLRAGFYTDGKLFDVIRVRAINFQNSDSPGSALYQAFLEQLTELLSSLLTKYPDSDIAIAFPGPVNERGIALSAPTLFGATASTIDIKTDCEQRFGRRVTVANDITAAIWRYAEPARENFGLFTISSGVGNKIFYNNQVLITKQGFGGEIGHCQTPSASTIQCDCSSVGHIGSISSGRGTVKLCQSKALQLPENFAESELFDSCNGNVDEITTEKFVSAVKSGDTFANEILQLSQQPLVDAMQHLYHAIGVHRFVFIGGFCLALGEHYVNQLNATVRLREWFHLPDEVIANMCELGVNDDDHSLIGLGKMPQLEAA